MQAFRIACRQYQWRAALREEEEGEMKQPQKNRRDTNYETVVLRVGPARHRHKAMRQIGWTSIDPAAPKSSVARRQNNQV